MPDADGKPKSQEVDADALMRQIDLELIQKRGEWQSARSQRSNLRGLAFLFLFFVIIAGLLAYFFLIAPGVSDSQSKRHVSPTPVPSASMESR